MEREQPDAKRRTFLTAAACAPAIAAGILLTRERTVVEAVLPEPGSDEAAATGYRETEHIRQYYRSAAY